MDLLETSVLAEIATQPDFRRLMRHIDRASGIFSMVFVIWDRADTEHEVYDAIRARLGAKDIERLPLPCGDAVDIFRRIEEAGFRGPDVVVVEGLYRAFPDRVRTSSDDRPPILQTLNLYRDRLRLHPVCLVLLLPEHALDLVARASPDFWSWRSGVFTLQPPQNVASSFAGGTVYATAANRDGDAPLSRDEVEAEAARLSALWSERFGEITTRELPSAAGIAGRLVGLYRRQARFALAEDWRGRAIELLQRIAADESDPTARSFAWVKLAALWGQSPLGDRAENQRKAIAACEAALTVYTRDAYPGDWAVTNNNLGNSWVSLPAGDPADSFRRAISAYEAALSVYTRGAYPVEWAMTQNNLGTAWANLPTGDRADNLRRAITAYEAALSVYTRGAYPVEWALTQNNLGTAWKNLPTGDRADNLRQALAAYEATLSVRTRDARPIAWAATQNNIGNAWAEMPTGSRAENLGKAIAAYEGALTVYARDALPVDWATTQNNLGAAWANLLTGDRAENLRNAIAAYEAALTVRTRDAHPIDWATTQHNRAITLANLADMPGEDRCGRLRQAIACGKGALSVYAHEAFPREHANAIEMLRIYQQAYESIGCATAIPFDDIPAVE